MDNRISEKRRREGDEIEREQQAMRDLTENEAAELELFSKGDRKLKGLIGQVMDEFDRTGRVGPVKERLIKKRLAKVKRRGARR